MAHCTRKKVAVFELRRDCIRTREDIDKNVKKLRSQKEPQVKCFSQPEIVNVSNMEYLKVLLHLLHTISMLPALVSVDQKVSLHRAMHILKVFVLSFEYRPPRLWASNQQSSTTFRNKIGLKGLLEFHEKQDSSCWFKINL
ncbi:hypothetical protein HELRODRAFT_179443 [Helobdella robusta]|uniref:Uncharacterized protein n=1 Tax=Helobdella robusta TaxID=6412 RepID=T1FEQ2_HELRO|nr:hypothetical protein HELRODRAFT_179443 [Helobdella robusta]ESN95372.1 hypothetical protein HELRODRAFT_179443 [Helobdella robusta]